MPQAALGDPTDSDGGEDGLRGPAASEEEWRARPALPTRRAHLDLGLHLLSPSQLLCLGDGRGEKLGFKGWLGGVGDLLRLALSSDLLCSDLKRERQPRLGAGPGLLPRPHTHA